MKINEVMNSRIGFWVQIFAVYAWLTVLSPLAGTDTYYSVYILCGIAGLLCLFWNHWTWLDMPLSSREQKAAGRLTVCGVLYALAVVLANYALFEPFSSLQNVWNLFCCLAGGFSVAYQILWTLWTKLPIVTPDIQRRQPGRVFLFVFFSVALIDLAYLLFVLYPGVLTKDAISTMAQILGHRGYDNVMPFWHTVTVEVFVELGLRLFGDINAAIALFHVVQILFMAACMGLVVMTLYQIGAPAVFLGAVIAIYALMPYNIVYSVTLWKDVPFSGAAVLMIAGLYRLIKGVGRHTWLNYGLFIGGTIGFSLWRTNGWYAFLVTVLVMLFLMRKKFGKLIRIMALVLLLCWVLINPVLDALAVTETDFVEAFAVPMQQVARVVASGRELSEEQTEMLSEIFDIEQIPQKYDPKTVDPIKFETFRYEKVDHILENWQEYLKLYVELGLQHPGDYGKAWIEETKGYWNGGYRYWVYTLQMEENQYGIFQTRGENLFSRIFGAAFRFAERQGILQWTTSIGLYVWVLIACTIINVLKRREEFLLSIPLLVLLLGLWLGAPVFAEFRYAYPVVLTLPLILGVTCFQQEQ
ncbi:MAG: hypothetical protein IJN67_13800 [Oscillospiraceae bacterium]|nr:hypothetical protein [Oscillospiraceae bacterium]